MRDQANNLLKLRRKITNILVPASRDDSEIVGGDSPALIKSLSPIRLLAILTITVFVVELAIMVGIEFAIDPESSLWFQVVEAVFDATALAIIVFPMLYRFSFRPLVLYTTDHQRIEAALKSSNALLENTFASLSDVVLVVSMPDRTVITCNSATSTVLGYETAELVGRGIAIFYENQADYRAFLDAVADTFQTGRFFQNECQLRRKDGRFLTAEVSVTQINNDTGDVVSQVIVIRDITRRKQDKAQLERHNQELQTLSRLGQAVVSSLELEAVLTHVIDQVKPLLKAECFSVLLLEGAELVNYAIGGIGAQTLHGLRMPADTGIVSETLKNSEPVLIDCQANACVFSPQIDAQMCGHTPYALMLAPLKVGDETIGLIQAVNEKPNSFNANDLQMLQAAANWAAIAISHARQHEEIQRRLRETATLAAINQSLNETLDLDSILQLIADSTPKLLPNVDRVVIHLLKENENLLYPAIWSGQAHLDTPALYMNSSEGVAGQALRSGKLVNVPDVDEDPYFIPFPASPPFKTLMVAPLQSGRNQLGTISVHNERHKNAFSVTDEQLLMRLADSAAITIATANLYQAERTQRQFAETQVQVAAALSVSLRLNEVLQTILDQTLRIVIRGEKVAIYLLKEGEVYLTRSTDEQELPKRLPEALHRIFTGHGIGNAPPSQLIAMTGKPILITDTEDEPSWPNEAGAGWLKSFVAAPLRVRNEIVGFLNVHSTKPAAFDKDTIRQLEALAAHASLAIHNATLYNELKNALQNEQSARAQLVQAQKLSAMGRMVASVAHELNNPLQTIKNCLFLTQQDVDQEADAHTYIDMALSETKRLSDLVLQLREVYRPGGRGPKKPLDLAQLMREVSLILNQHLKDNHSKWVQNQWSGDNLIVNADANQLKQVMLNICLNGIEAMQPDGGTLSVELFVDPETAETGVSIQDSGPGIPPDDLAHLFEPFFTTKETGAGLGLAICYDIIQSHGGRIEAKSVLDQGATFTIWLPTVNRETVTVQEA